MNLFLPILYALKNRWIKSHHRSTTFLRDFTLILFGVFLLYGIFRGTKWLLLNAQDILTYAYLSPALPLGLVLLTLFGMLVISNTVNVIGSFFLSEDIDLLVATPIKGFSFFFQRLSIVGIGTSVIPFFFLFPVFLSYGMWFKQGWLFYGVTVFSLIPYFLIPLGLSFFLSTLLALFVPVKRAKSLYILILLILLASIYFGIEILTTVVSASSDASALMRITRVFSAAYIPYAPSTWIGEIVQELLQPQGISIATRLSLLWGCAALSLLGAGLLFALTYRTAYSSAKNHKSSQHHAHALFSLRPYFPISAKQMFSIWVKDAVSLLRDMSQLFQGILLFGIYAIYIYNIRILAFFNAMDNQDPWWRNFVFIANFCMSAFIASAVCTRFVFPALSLEGRFFVLLKKAPLSIRQLVKIKFIFWYIIVALIHSLVVGTGAYASGATLSTLLLNISSSWIICYGLTGLAIGMGGYFSRFDWEHSSQLAVGFGNIIFMLTASVLILSNMVPVWILLFTLPAIGIVSIAKTLYIACIGIVFCAVNVLIGQVALEKGIERLEEME